MPAYVPCNVTLNSGDGVDTGILVLAGRATASAEQARAGCAFKDCRRALMSASAPQARIHPRAGQRPYRGSHTRAACTPGSCALLPSRQSSQVLAQVLLDR